MGDLGRGKEEKEFRIEFSFCEMAWGQAPNDLGTDPKGVSTNLHESSRIDTNFVQICEIRVNSWTVTSTRAYLALGHLENRWRGGALSCLDGGRGRISRRP